MGLGGVFACLLGIEWSGRVVCVFVVCGVVSVVCVQCVWCVYVVCVCMVCVVCICDVCGMCVCCGMYVLCVCMCVWSLAGFWVWETGEKLRERWLLTPNPSSQADTRAEPSGPATTPLPQPNTCPQPHFSFLLQLHQDPVH